MKIFAVIHNYGNSPAEGALAGEGEPICYQMADSSILKSGNPFFIPDFDESFVGFPSIVYRVGRLGKGIAPRFAARYIDAWGIAVAVVATGTLKRLRSHGFPWTEAVSFDRSCLLGNLKPIDTLNNNEVMEIACGDAALSYSPRLLRRPIDEIVSLLSRQNTLKNGDLILCGLTPDGLPLLPDRKLEARSTTSETKFLDINIK